MNPYNTEVIALDLPIASLLLILAWLICWWWMICFYYMIPFIQKVCSALFHFCKNSQFKHLVECSLLLNAVVIPKHRTPYPLFSSALSSAPSHTGHLTFASSAFHWIPSKKLVQLLKWHKTHPAKE